MSSSRTYFNPPPRKKHFIARLFGKIPIWLSIILFVVGIVVIPIFLCGYLPSIIIGYFGEQSRPVPGDASNFDPIAHYDELEAYASAGEPISLLSLTARYVRSDGTMDLYADYLASVDIRYIRQLDEPPADAPPIGAGGSPDGIYYEPFAIRIWQPNQLRNVSRGNTEYTYLHFGMVIERSNPVTSYSQTSAPPPECSFKQLWDAARTRDAPDRAVAVISYDADGYLFSINDVNIRLRFNLDCSLKE